MVSKRQSCLDRYQYDLVSEQHFIIPNKKVYLTRYLVEDV